MEKDKEKIRLRGKEVVEVLSKTLKMLKSFEKDLAEKNFIRFKESSIKSCLQSLCDQAKEQIDRLKPYMDEYILVFGNDNAAFVWEYLKLVEGLKGYIEKYSRSGGSTDSSPLENISREKKSGSYLKVFLIWSILIFIICRFAVVQVIFDNVERMSRTYISFVEKHFPGTTYDVDSDFIKGYILPKNKFEMVLDIRKWTTESFAEDGDIGWYKTVNEVYQQEEFIAASKKCDTDAKASMTFDERQKKWRSSGVKPSLKKAREAENK